MQLLGPKPIEDKAMCDSCSDRLLADTVLYCRIWSAYEWSLQISDLIYIYLSYVAGCSISSLNYIGTVSGHIVDAPPSQIIFAPVI